MFKGKKVIIFDMDGTLIDSVGVWNKVDMELIKELGGLDELNELDIQQQRDKKLREYSKNEAKERNVGNNMKIKDLYSGKNMPIVFVIGKLNGFHGTFKNTKSIKYYFIIVGKAKVKIDDELNEVEKGDFVLIHKTT